MIGSVFFFLVVHGVGVGRTKSREREAGQALFGFVFNNRLTVQRITNRFTIRINWLTVNTEPFVVVIRL